MLKFLILTDTLEDDIGHFKVDHDMCARTSCAIGAGPYIEIKCVGQVLNRNSNRIKAKGAQVVMIVQL